MILVTNELRLRIFLRYIIVYKISKINRLLVRQLTVSCVKIFCELR